MYFILNKKRYSKDNFNSNFLYNSLNNSIITSSGGSTPIDYTVKPNISTPRTTLPRANGWIMEFDINTSAPTVAGENNLLGPGYIRGQNVSGATTVAYETGSMGRQIHLQDKSLIDDGSGPFTGTISYTGISGEGYSYSMIYELKTGVASTSLLQSSLMEIYHNVIYPAYGLGNFSTIALDSTSGVHHIIVIINSGTATVYQDDPNIAVGSFSIGGSPPVSFVGTSIAWRVGSFFGTGDNFGLIGMRLWNRPLSASEITQEFDAPWELIT